MTFRTTTNGVFVCSFFLLVPSSLLYHTPPNWEADAAQSEGLPSPCKAQSIALESYLALIETLPVPSVSEAQ